jgi:hypothetical protein
MEKNVSVNSFKGATNMGRNITWREEWKRPYKSIWSVIENIKISNWIDGSELSQYINENTTSKSRRLRNVNKLSDEALTKLKELTNIDFFEIKTTMLKLSKLEQYNPLHYFHTHLCCCEKCIQYNYHSYLHQYKLETAMKITWRNNWLSCHVSPLSLIAKK